MVLCPTAGCCRGGRVARREVALIVVIKSTAFPRVVVLALVARPLVVAPLPLGTRGRATLDLRPLRLALRVVPLPLSLLLLLLVFKGGAALAPVGGLRVRAAGGEGGGGRSGEYRKEEAGGQSVNRNDTTTTKNPALVLQSDKKEVWGCSELSVLTPTFAYGASLYL